MTVRARSYRLVPVAVGAWAAAGVSLLMTDVSGWIAVGLWVATVGAAMVSVVTRRGAPLAAVVIVTLAVAAAAAAASHTALTRPARDAASALAVDGGRAIEVAAVVTGKPARSASGQLWFDAHASTVTIGTVRHRVDVPIAVRGLSTDQSVIDVGAVVVVAGTAFRPEAGDRAVLVVDAARRIEVRAPPHGVLLVASTLRSRLVEAVEGLPEPGAQLVPGLAVGDTASVSPELDVAMKQSSLAHLTAVSGANCAIVVGLVFALSALCGARRGVRVGVSLLALTGFVVLVTPEPSVVRAAVMAAIAMLGVALGRLGSGMSMLCVAVTCALVGDPWLAASLGFALSVAATASLLVLARPIAVGLERAMPRSLALAVAVPIAAQLACGPLLVLVEPTVALFGVVANLVAGPAAPAATILGLVACLSAPLPWLQHGLAAVAWLPAAWIAVTAQVFGTLPGGQLPWLEGFPGLALLAVIGGAVAVMIAAHGASRAVRAIRTTSALLVSVLVGVAGGLAALSTVAGPLTVPSGWAVVACDVGQGDAVLVRSAGRVALVDTGPDPAPLRACLSRVGVNRLDLLVLTHFDLDHVGGVAAVTGMAVTVLHGPVSSDSDLALVAGLEAAGARAVQAYAGVHGVLGASSWRVLWPPEHSAAFPSGNDASVVLDVRGTGVPPTLLLGDLGASSQRALARSGALDPPYPVVKLAHHGSADQDAGLYDLARPAIAIVSVGTDNDYGHPRAEALRILSAAGSAVGRTDTGGLIAVVPIDSGLSLWRERAPPGVGGGG